MSYMGFSVPVSSSSEVSSPVQVKIKDFIMCHIRTHFSLNLNRTLIKLNLLVSCPLSGQRRTAPIAGPLTMSSMP
jgi:hypothetical protein